MKVLIDKYKLNLDFPIAELIGLIIWKKLTNLHNKDKAYEFTPFRMQICMEFKYFWTYNMDKAHEFT